MKTRIQVTSVSWIDGKNLPVAGHWMVAGGVPIVGSWVNRVVMGLIATSNPSPPREIPTVAAFRGLKQYRALTHYELHPSLPDQAATPILDPGFTPPFDKSKVDSWLIHFAPIPEEAKEFHAGEMSPISSIVMGKLHPASTIYIPVSDEVVASTLIKFRAGEVTNKIGIEEAESPVHVPWVWCEHALVRRNRKYLLLVNGSVFPSHAWYVNGSQITTRPQNPVQMSENEPALSTGRPTDEPRANAANDKSEGSVTGHGFAIGAGKVQSVDISRLVHQDGG